MKMWIVCVTLVFVWLLCLSDARFIEGDVRSLLAVAQVDDEYQGSCNLAGGKSSKEAVGSTGFVSLQVVNRLGPCAAHLNPSPIPQSELLRRDKERAEFIHARRRLSSSSDANVTLPLPTAPTSPLGTGSYVVVVGLGTPPQYVSLTMDTGSDATWTQCKPCVTSCYNQSEAMYEPAASSSFAYVSCTSFVCTELVPTSNTNSSCSSSTCQYTIEYGDKSFSVGSVATERLTLTSTDYLDGYVFGCGEDNGGIFEGAAGLIGLGRNNLSLITQAAPKYGFYFSYCLPSSTSTSPTGRLTLGRGGTRGTDFSYTPLLTGSDTGYYFIGLESISVAGNLLPISPSEFSDAGTFIDSGTLISALPPRAYSALSSAFNQHMSNYPSVPSASGYFPTCYNLTDYKNTTVPSVSLYFGGGGVLNLPMNGILFPDDNVSQVYCLAFTANANDTDAAIIGSVQQQTFDVVYDVDGDRIGFAPNGC